MSKFDKDHFKRKLSNLDDRQDSIQNLASWILKHSDHCSQIVESWMYVFKISPEQEQVNMLYVANDVIQNCKRKKAPQFRTEFRKSLKQAFEYCKNSSRASSVGHIVDIWDDRGVFNPDLCADLRSIINYSKGEKRGQKRSSPKHRSDDRPVMQVKPMPKEFPQDTDETDDEWKKQPKDFFELETTTAVLKKCSKRKRQFDEKLSKIDENGTFVIDKLTSYCASDETVSELFTDLDDMRAKIDSSKTYLEDFVDLLSKKLKYESYCVKCLDRAQHYFKHQHSERRAFIPETKKALRNPLKLQASIKSRKNTLQANQVSSQSVLKHVVSGKTEQREMLVASANEVQSSRSSATPLDDLEAVSDSEQEDDEYSPPQLDRDVICSPPPLSRGIPIKDTESSVVQSESKAETSTKTVKSNKAHSSTESAPIPTVSISNTPTAVSEATNIPHNTFIIPASVNLSQIGQVSPLMTPQTPEKQFSLMTQQVNTVLTSPLMNGSQPSAIATPGTPTTLIPQNQNSPPKPSMPNFLAPNNSPMPPPFLFPPVSGALSNFSNPPPMPPPIPFPPPSNFPPPPFPFFPPVLSNNQYPMASSALLSMSTVSTVTSQSMTSMSAALPIMPSVASTLSNSIASTMPEPDAITINADVHAALSSLLGEAKPFTS